MSVAWRPPRKTLLFLAVFLCLASVSVLFAQQENAVAAVAPLDYVGDIGAVAQPQVAAEPVINRLPDISELEPVTFVEPASPMETAITISAPISETISPIIEDSVSPVTETISPIIEDSVYPITETISPVIEDSVSPITETISPVIEDSVAPVTETISPIIEDSVAPVTEITYPVIEDSISPVDKAINDITESVYPFAEAVSPFDETVNSVNALDKAANPVAEAGAVTVTPATITTGIATATCAIGSIGKACFSDIFDFSRLNVLIVILTLMTFVTYFTFHAQRGKEMFIRRISGLSALEDAVGRATEMGRGVMYIPGIMDMDDPQTIAGVTILGHVAKKTAEYDTPLYAPMTRSFVMSVAQEVVKQSYLEKGRPDAFRPDRINYLTDDQFGYVAGASGIMVREKPAACFFLGTFYAESLILSETGNSVGAIQIAGTAEPSQIPFFVASCDYTLIGEELFAASAYLSKNPKEIGSLKGQDFIKLLIIILMIVGTILVTIAGTEVASDTFFITLANDFMRLLIVR